MCINVFNKENKGIFLVNGETNIKVYRSGNYENIKTIDNLQFEYIIKGFIEYDNKN